MVEKLTVEELKRLIDYFLLIQSSHDVEIIEDLDEVVEILNKTGMALFGIDGNKRFFVSHDEEKGEYNIALEKTEDIFKIPRDALTHVAAAKDFIRTDSIKGADEFWEQFQSDTSKNNKKKSGDESRRKISSVDFPITSYFSSN